jgi:hypothetical protein
LQNIVNFRKTYTGNGNIRPKCPNYFKKSSLYVLHVPKFSYIVSNDAGASDRIKLGERMKVKKNSVRRTLSVSSYAGDEFRVENPRIRAVRVREGHLNRKAFTQTKTIRIKGDCRKRRFRDIEEALEALHQIERFRYFSGQSETDKSNRRENRVYKCPSCLGAHLTSKPLLSELVMQVA